MVHCLCRLTHGVGLELASRVNVLRRGSRRQRPVRRGACRRRRACTILFPPRPPSAGGVLYYMARTTWEGMEPYVFNQRDRRARVGALFLLYV